MAWPDLTYRSRLEPELRNELELVMALTQGYLSSEHDAAGQHTTITVDGIQFRARDGSILATITVIDGSIVITFPPTSPPNANGGLQVDDVLVGHHHSIPGTAWAMHSGIDMNTDAGPFTGGDQGNKWLIGVGTDQITGAGHSALVFGNYEAANTLGGGPALYYAPSVGGYAFCPPASGSTGTAYSIGHTSDSRLRWDGVNAIIVDAQAGYRERGRLVGQGDWAHEAFNAANFTNPSGAWIVDAADVIANEYMLIGNTLFWTIALASTTVPAATGGLRIRLPGGLTTTFPAGAFIAKPGFAYDAVGPQLDYNLQVANSTQIDVHRGGNAIPAGDFHLYFTMIIGLAGL
jgi:hypothetical protein